MVYAIDSESGPTNHANWVNGVRIAPLDEDRVIALIPGFPHDGRPYQGAAGEGCGGRRGRQRLRGRGPELVIVGGRRSIHQVRRGNVR